ncbi:beta-galactosidase GalB [Niabella terrae]
MAAQTTVRQRIPFNEQWKFFKTQQATDSNYYERRPDITAYKDGKVADTRATESALAQTADGGLKKWILPGANSFIKDPARHWPRPATPPPAGPVFAEPEFNDQSWETVQIPHDWAIGGPFYVGEPAVVGGGMGRLPIQGVGWYRKKIKIPAGDRTRQYFLDIDGAMSYAIVWINGQLAGGWPYGYNSFRIDMTPFLRPGADNQIAIRIDNPNYAARWYPGAGLYRNVWLVSTGPVHIAHWGSFIQATDISKVAAKLELELKIVNQAEKTRKITAQTALYLQDGEGRPTGPVAGRFKAQSLTLKPGTTQVLRQETRLAAPKLWEPLPDQQQNLYVAVTRVYENERLIDEYTTPFGIRSLEFDAEKGLLVNGKKYRIQGVNQHHDLGALGAAFNLRAAERQLEMLRELGCNAIRLAHNPPAPELLALTDRMGFLVIDEIFDCWEKGKTPHDFHLIFHDWHEADIRSFIRRDRNHPSVIAWSFGNEVGEQYTDSAGAALARSLYEIVHQEDNSRPATASMNFAKPDMPFAAEMDIISLNYQGEGIRDAPAYAHLKGIRTSPLYPAFHKKFPNKLIFSSETASTLSSREYYFFPVTPGISAPVSDSSGGEPVSQSVSAYELYTAQFGASPDKVFASQDRHPFVAGEFVWTGWDYVGEPTPYYGARSSYSGIIDLAGFKKDRFYLYQSRWRPELPMAHILPHWNWPDRMDQVTPVHVFTSGDEAELFLNGKSLGRKKKGAFEYRLRWDEIRYEPGTLKVVAYKNGRRWAMDSVSTTGPATRLELKADRSRIHADGQDLAFVTVSILDAQGRPVPDSQHKLHFSLEGPGRILATDNGDPADMTSFHAMERKAYHGRALVILEGTKDQPGRLLLKVSSPGLSEIQLDIETK